MSDPQLTVCPLGGLGEIGLNCMMLSTAETAVVVDCGLIFPDDALFGVDIAIPRFDHILLNRSNGICQPCCNNSEQREYSLVRYRLGSYHNTPCSILLFME